MSAANGNRQPAHHFFFNHPPTTEIYTLSLHDALPIYLHLKLIPVDGPLGRREIAGGIHRSEEHTSELQSHSDLVCRLLLEKKKPHMAIPLFVGRRKSITKLQPALEAGRSILLDAQTSA